MRRALIVAFAAALVIVPAAGAWTWPVKGPVLQKFVLGSKPSAAGQHRGIDIGAAAGDPVVAAACGTVSFVGTVRASGRFVTIQTAEGYSVTLTHLGSTSARRGETVGEGSIVGTIGPTGDVEHDTPYVHLGLRHSEDPNGYVDPLLFLPAPVAPPAAPVAAAPSAPVPSAAPPPPAVPSASAAPPSAAPHPGASAPGTRAPPRPVARMVRASPGEVPRPRATSVSGLRIGSAHRARAAETGRALPSGAQPAVTARRHVRSVVHSGPRT